MSNLTINGSIINSDCIPPKTVYIDGDLAVKGQIKSICNSSELKDGDILVVSLNVKACPEMASPDGIEYLGKYCEYLSEIFPNNKVLGQPHFIDIGIIRNTNNEASSLRPF